MRPDSFYDHVLVTGAQRVIIDYLRGCEQVYKKKLAAPIIATMKDRIYSAGSDWPGAFDELEAGVRALEPHLLPECEGEWGRRALAEVAFELGVGHGPLLLEKANMQLEAIINGHAKSVQWHQKNDYFGGNRLRPPFVRIMTRPTSCASCRESAASHGDMSLEEACRLRPLPHEGCTSRRPTGGFCRCDYWAVSAPGGIYLYPWE